MRAVELMSEVDKLPYHRRMATLAKHARALPATPEVPPLLAELLAGDPFHREIALFMARVIGRDDVITGALTDTDWHIREVALRGWLRGSPPGGGAALLSLLDDAAIDTRQRVYRLVAQLRRADLADALIDQVRARFGDVEAGRLLPVCTSGPVERLLPDLWQAIGGWTVLARRHPAALLAEAGRQLAALPVPARPAWWWRFGYSVLVAGKTRPTEVVELLERFAPETTLPGRLEAYGVLAAADPLRVRDLFAAPGRVTFVTQQRLPRAVLNRLARLTPAELAPLARRVRGNEPALSRLLASVPPHQRAELFDLAQSDVDTAQAIYSDVLLRTLPRERRIAEARRILGLAEVRGDERRALHFTAFLPWDEAEAALLKATRRADADDRSAGYERLIACADHSGQPATVTLAARHLLRIRNEQDPVRASALSAFARVRPGLFEPAVAEVLRQLTTDAIEARDGSSMTTRSLGTLAVTVLREHYDEPDLVRWATDAFERLFGTDRIPHFGSLAARLRHGQEAVLFAAVRDWVAAGVRRGKFGPLFTVAHSLQKRAWRLPELQEMLRDAIVRATTSDAQQAIRLWLDDPATRSVRVETVLRADPSAVAIHQVWTALSNRRTDLLDRVLIGRPPKGRFLPSNVRWVPPYVQNIRRWLPRQQRAYAGLLATIAADHKATTHARVRAIAAAARIPAVGWDIVTGYLTSTSVNLMEAALGALAWTDRPADALPILLSHVDGDRARVAVYAASRASRYVPPSALRTALIDGPLAHGKVTSRKEAIRLLATTGAADALLAVWRRDDEHRDVRAAVVSAARQHCDDSRLWPILSDAATGSREEAVALLAGGPYTVPERMRTRYAALVTRAGQSDDAEVAAAAWRVLPDWAPWTPDAAAPVIARLTDLDDHHVWRVVVPGVVTLARSMVGADLLAQIATALADLDERDPTRGDPERDRPARRRLDEVIATLRRVPAMPLPDADREALRSAGLALAIRPAFVPQAATLLTMAAVPLIHSAGPEPFVAALDELGALLAGRPVAAARVATDLSAEVRRQPAVQPDLLLAAGALLAERADVTSGLLAVALATQGATFGWPEPWRSLVHRLRAHPEADVQTLALDTHLSR